MKKMLTLITVSLLLQQLTAQTTTSGRIEGLRDAWGTTIDYVGEIKNKQPNGLGIAIYSNGIALRYSGNFVNGQYSGKGVLLFKDSSFLSGDWKNGKLNGKGANLSNTGDLYVGYFADGKKDGKGTFMYADNSLLVGNMQNDTYEGRCIYIPASGKTISDNIYTAGKKNGSGYQYELDSKTLYEGTWNNGDWVSSSTASYKSFLKADNFTGEKNDEQILMGLIDKNNNNSMQDTGFFYDLDKQKRYFGYSDKGLFTDGLIIKDSTRFLGKVNDDGAYGPCSFYKLKKFYDEGNYQNDYLTGDGSLSIDLHKMTTYYGSTADKGLFSGQAWFTNNYNELYKGNYEDGAFNGSGYIVFRNGTTVKGTFKDGKTMTVTSFTDGNGAAISQNPKTISEALSTVINEYSNDYEALIGQEADEDDYSFDDYYSADNSIITLPGSVGDNVILEDYDFYLMYNATMYDGMTYKDAQTKYDELCKSLAGVSLHLKRSTAPVTLSGNIEPAQESETTRTDFTFNNYSTLKDYHIYAELKYNEDDDKYTVNLVAGDIVFDD
ncbi:MAG: hypothetical protein ABI405_03380 [Parafilimonas sp.]